MTKEKSIEKVVITYDNGEQREITKGVVIGFNHNEAEDTESVTFDMLDIRGKDLKIIVLSVLGFADDLGILDELDPELP